MTSVDYRTPIEAGIAGTLAYAVGFVGTYLSDRDRPPENATLVTGEDPAEEAGYTVAELREIGGGDGLPSAVEFAGWRHHRAHFAGLEGTVRFDGGSRIPAEVTVDPGTLTYVLPAVLLFAAGYWLSARYPAANAIVAAARGTYVAIGYVLPAIVTIFVLEWTLATASGTLVIRPEPATAIAMTGIIYPVLAGGIGGYLAHEIHAEDAIGRQFG